MLGGDVERGRPRRPAGGESRGRSTFRRRGCLSFQWGPGAEGGGGRIGRASCRATCEASACTEYMHGTALRSHTSQGLPRDRGQIQKLRSDSACRSLVRARPACRSSLPARESPACLPRKAPGSEGRCRPELWLQAQEPCLRAPPARSRGQHPCAMQRRHGRAPASRALAERKPLQSSADERRHGTCSAGTAKACVPRPLY